MNIGNNNIIVGKRFDTGKKWVDSAGAGHAIYRKALAVGPLPNATTKNVAHGETPNIVTKYMDVVALWASDGTTVKTKDSADIAVQVTATNVAITSAGNLSAFINGVVVIEFCL